MPCYPPSPTGSVKAHTDTAEPGREKGRTESAEFEAEDDQTPSEREIKKADAPLLLLLIY